MYTLHVLCVCDLCNILVRYVTMVVCMFVRENLLPLPLFKEFFEGAPETFALLPATLAQRSMLTFIGHALPFQLLPHRRFEILRWESTCA